MIDAVIVAVPSAIAVILPDSSTESMSGLLEVQVYSLLYTLKSDYNFTPSFSVSPTPYDAFFEDNSNFLP